MSSDSTVKQDTLGGHYSLILRKQSSKPNDVAQTTTKRALKPIIPDVPGCLFCKGAEAGNSTTYLHPELETGLPWKTRGVVNKWTIGDPHNVLVLTPEHKGLYDLTIKQWEAAILGLQYFDLGRKSLIFANQGPLAGGSQPHAHAQIVGLDILPVNNFEERSTSGKDCVLCPTQPAELVVWESEKWVIYSPVVPQLGGELRLVRRAHEGSWSPDMSEGLVELINLTGIGYDWEDFSLLFHVTNVEHAHVHILPRRTPVSVLKLGWDIGTVKDPKTYAQKLRKLRHL